MVKLLSIGTALPAGRLPQEQAFEQARSYNCTSEKEERVLQKLYRRTLIQSRPTIFALNEFYPRPRSRTAGDTATTNPVDRAQSVLEASGVKVWSGEANSLDCQPGTAARMARYKEEITPLAMAAARQALEKIDLPASSVGNLVTVSCTGFFSPGLDTEIIDALSLSRSVSRTNVGFMGCHGAMNGLRVAAALARESQSISLVVAAELCSLHFQYGRKSDDLLANALFADGAAAAVLAPSASLAPGRSIAPGPSIATAISPAYELTASASYLVPESRQAMTWQIGDHGFHMTLGSEVPSLIEEHLAPWLTGWLDSYGLTIEGVGSWAVHPGGPRVLDAVEQALGLEGQALAPSRQIFTSLGNMSSPTILFILERLVAQAAAPPVVALAFGPGLTIEAALFH